MFYQSLPDNWFENVGQGRGWGTPSERPLQQSRQGGPGEGRGGWDKTRSKSGHTLERESYEVSEGIHTQCTKKRDVKSTVAVYQGGAAL